MSHDKEQSCKDVSYSKQWLGDVGRLTVSKFDLHFHNATSLNIQSLFIRNTLLTNILYMQVQMKFDTIVLAFESVEPVAGINLRPLDTR